MNPVYLYLRVSSQGQADGHGFDRQQQTIERFCNRHRHAVKGVYRESISGTKEQDDRPQFKAMVTDILKNGVDTIVVESLDRLAREYRIQEQLLIYLASKGIHLIAANTGENITEAIQSDPMKKAMIQIQGVFAELDKSLLVKKLRLAREQVRKDRGKCEGRKSYKETPDGAEVLKIVRRLRRKGKGKKVPTWNAVADHLNAEGYRNKHGREFKAGSLKVLMCRTRKG